MYVPQSISKYQKFTPVVFPSAVRRFFDSVPYHPSLASYPYAIVHTSTAGLLPMRLQRV